MRRAAAALVGVLLVTLAVGCGGTSRPVTRTVASARPVTADPRATFVARADAICRDAHRASDRANARVAALRHPSDAAVADAVRAAVRTQRRYAVRLAALEAPPALATTWRAYLSAGNEAIDRLGDMAGALAEHDGRSALTARRRGARAAARARRAARALGFAECGSSS